MPLFGGMNLNGNGAIRGEIYAYRDASGAKTGYKNITSTTTVAAYTPYYYSPTHGGSFLPIAGSAQRPGYTPGTVLNKEIIGQKNRWIMHNHWAGTLVQNIDFRIGGSEGTPGNVGMQPGDAAKYGENGVLLIRNDSSMKIKDSTIELMGRATISTDILHWGANYLTSLELENVTIKITGNQNTLFNNVPYSDQGTWSTVDINSKFVDWGRPRQDNGLGKQGVFGKTTMGIDTSTNTIYYISASNSYRWNGYNGADTTLSDGTTAKHSHIANPEALLVYTPLMEE